MRNMSSEELRHLEVINLCTGERLGFPCEFQIDIECARVIALSVYPESSGFCFWGERDEYIIPWCKIECIGEDEILVKLTYEELCTCSRGKHRKKHK